MKKLLAILFIIGSLHSHSQAIKAAVTMRHSTAASSSLLNGLVGGWKMNESSGNITDYSGNSNTGTANGTLTYSQSGILNNAILFDGSTSYFDMGNTSSLSLTSAGSISAWVYCSNVTVRNTIVDKKNLSASQNGYHLDIDAASHFYWELSDAASSIGNESVTTVSANTWYNVVFTWDGVHINLYINGTLESGYPQNETVTPVSNVYNFRIGTRNDVVASVFNGKINNVYVWNRAITSTEVSTLYNSGSGKAYPF